MEKITEKLINLKGGEINTVTFGKGKPLFLLPGWTYSGKIFLLLAPWVAENYRVTTIDLPGWIGKTKLKLVNNNVQSYVDLIAESIEKIYKDEKQSLTLGGVSIGGTMAFLAASRLNGRVKKIFLQSAPLNGALVFNNRKGRGFLLNKFGGSSLSGSFWKFCHKVGGVFLFLRCRLGEQTSLKLTLLRELLQDYKNLDPKAVIEFTKDFLASDFSKEAKEINCPVILVACEKDGLVPPREVKLTAQEIFSESIFCEVPKAHHFFLGEDPKGFAEIIQKYL